MSDKQFIQHAYQKELLDKSLREVFGDFSDELLLDIELKMEWVEILGGETLFHQGETGDALFFIISGRLRAFTEDEHGKSSAIGDIMRGEMVGEMAIFTGENRMASVVAIRDSVLVKVTKAVFEEVIRAYPMVSMNMTKIIINRLNNSQNPRKKDLKPVNICLIPISKSVDIQAFSEQLYTQLERTGDVLLLNSAIISQIHRTEHLAQADKQNLEGYRQLTNWLDEQEAKHNFMLYVTDTTTSEWTKRCIRSADEIYLVADADDTPHLCTIEQELFAVHAKNGVSKNLILLHDNAKICPSHTDKWLKPRFLKAHYHIRPNLSEDMARIGRIVSGTAIGLVLAGGGAKGIAHLGIYKALHELGIPIDYIGGTSAGALMGTLIAFNMQPKDIESVARKAALYNPTKDYTLFPFISLIKGNRLEKVIKQAIHESVGFDVLIEDTWIPFFTVSCNYTHAREEVHTHGRLFNRLRSSISIPGAFPPVVSGNDLLIDGGTFNNFPTDVMSRFGVAKIIGVDLSRDKIHKLELEHIPTGLELLRDKFRPKHRKKYRLPTLISILLNTTMLYSNARQKQAKQYTDLYFNPEVNKFGLMDWTAFDKIFAIGYEHAKSILSTLPAEVLAKFKV